MFTRTIAPTLNKAVAQFPITALTGPRQSGKTTLLKSQYPHFRYINLENPSTFDLIQEDPVGYFHSNKGDWIIDEAQNFPKLFSYLQTWVDDDYPGKFILSGSQNFLLLEKVSQSLAGRAMTLELLPLRYKEFISHQPARELWDYLYHGSYPKPYDKNIDIDWWYQSYMKTYLERDIRQLSQLKDLRTFQLFLKHCASRHGQLLNLNSLAVDCGVSQPTAKQWLNLLEASYIIFRLPPYHENFGKRLVKTPKLYFYDSALVCQLLGIDSPEHLSIHANRGAIFEGYIISEWLKHQTSFAKPANAYFWRDQTGHEIDLLIEQHGKLNAVEIKSSMTYKTEFTKGLKKWPKISGEKTGHLNLVYAGDETIITNSLSTYSWRDWLIDE